MIHGDHVVLINESSLPVNYTLRLKSTHCDSDNLLCPLVVAGQESGAIVVISDSAATGETTSENGAFLFGGVKHQKK